MQEFICRENRRGLPHPSLVYGLYKKYGVYWTELEPRLTRKSAITFKNPRVPLIQREAATPVAPPPPSVGTSTGPSATPSTTPGSIETLLHEIIELRMEVRNNDRDYWTFFKYATTYNRSLVQYLNLRGRQGEVEFSLPPEWCLPQQGDAADDDDEMEEDAPEDVDAEVCSEEDDDS